MPCWRKCCSGHSPAYSNHTMHTSKQNIDLRKIIAICNDGVMRVWKCVTFYVYVCGCVCVPRETWWYTTSNWEFNEMVNSEQLGANSIFHFHHAETWTDSVSLWICNWMETVINSTSNRTTCMHYNNHNTLDTCALFYYDVFSLIFVIYWLMVRRNRLNVYTGLRNDGCRWIMENTKGCEHYTNDT